MGDTFGCNCCCTDDQPEKLVNTEKQSNYIVLNDTSKVFGESSTNTKSYDSDNEEYSMTNDNNENDSSVSETYENINKNENETNDNENMQNIDKQLTVTENIINENETQYESNINENETNIKHSIIDTEKTENETTENVKTQQTIAENIMHKNEYETIINEDKLISIDQTIEDKNDIDEDLDNYDKQKPLEIIDDKNNNDSDDMDAELAKLNNIQNYDKQNTLEIMKIDNDNDNDDSDDDMDAELAKLNNIKNYDMDIKEENGSDDMGSDKSMRSIYSDDMNYENNIIHMKIPNNIIESNESKNEWNEKSKNRLLLKKYKSEREMLDDESIESLLQMKLSNAAFKILGNQKLYEIPTKKNDRFHLERDLRKIKLALKDFKISERRKYAKIAILKHIDLLTAVYLKYCKIGGDRHCLNNVGWIKLLSDTKLIAMGNDNNKYFEIFTKTYNFHNKSKQNKNKSKKNRHSTQLSGLYGDTSFHDKNPWTGVWCMEKDRHRINRIEKKKREKEERDRILNSQQHVQKKTTKKMNKKISIKQQSEQHFDKYKLRKIGDLRIIGCMNCIEYADIAGQTNKSNYRRAKLEIRFKKRRIKVHNQKRIWHCQIIPPKTIMDNIIMKVKWNEINQNSSRIKDGTFKLFKFDELNDNDIDLPISHYVGLARYEFFDAMLQISKLVVNDDEYQNNNDNPSIGGLLGDDIDDFIDNNEKDLFETFNELCVEYLNEYCYKNIVSLNPYLNGKEIREDIRIKMKGYNIILIKLFKKYASLDNDDITTKHEQHLDCDEWTAMAVELCKAAKSCDKNVWKLGGRPGRNEMVYCFILCKDEDLIMDEEIDFLEFQRCLLFFVNSVFKYYPKARYDDMKFENKLHLVLKWCEKLESQKIAISSKSYQRSDTLRHIKRKKSMHQNAQSNNQSTTIFGHDTPTFNRSNLSNPVDWNTISHSF